MYGNFPVLAQAAMQTYGHYLVNCAILLKLAVDKWLVASEVDECFVF